MARDPCGRSGGQLDNAGERVQSAEPDKSVVYLKCDTNAAYENILKVFEAVSKADVDRVGLAAAKASPIGIWLDGLN